MEREKEFAKNTVILAIGRYLPKLFAFITIPIITGQLSKTEYGTYDLIMTLVSLLLPVVTLQIQSAAFRFLIDCRDNEIDCSKIISNIFYFTFFTSLFTSIIFFFVYSGVPILTKMLICIYFFVDIMQIALGMSVRGLGNNLLYSVNAIVISVVNAGLIFCLLYVKNWGLNGLLVSTIVANSVAYIYVTSRLKFFKYIRIEYLSKPLLKELIAYSFPMIPNNLSVWFLGFSNRLIITAFLGLEANAVFAVANKIPKLLAEAEGIVVMAWQENASIVVKDDDADNYYSIMFYSMFKLVFSVTGILIAATPIIFIVLIRGNYSEAYVQIPILMVGMFFYCLAAFLGGIYVAYKKIINVAVTTMVAAGLNVILNLLFVKHIGITAASIATLLAYFVLLVLRMYGLSRFRKITYQYGKMLLQLAVLIGMCFLTIQQDFACNCINACLAVSFVYICNKSLIKKLLLKFR